MSEEIHDRHGAGFVRLGNLLPSLDDTASNTSNQVSPFQENANNIHTEKALGKERVIGGAGGKRERKGSSLDAAVDKPWMPQMLAEKLNDERNLAFYKFVVQRLPDAIIRDALVRALDTPLKNIRRSRGALFASIVSPHLKSRRSNPHSPSNST